jgi:hypothetical protein
MIIVSAKITDDQRTESRFLLGRNVDTGAHCNRYIRIILAKKQRTLTVYLLYGRCPGWLMRLCVHTENPRSISENIPDR